MHAKGRSLVGFREKMSSYVADVERCEVLVPARWARWSANCGRLVTALSIPERIPQIEVAVGDNAHGAGGARAGATNRRRPGKAAPPSSSSMACASCCRPAGPTGWRPLAGELPELWYELPAYDLKLAFEPADFIQVNGAMNRLLIDRVLRAAGARRRAHACSTCSAGWATSRCHWRAVPRAWWASRARPASSRGRGPMPQRNGLANAEFHVANLAGEEAVQRCLRWPGAVAIPMCWWIRRAPARWMCCRRWPASRRGGWSMCPATRAASRATSGFW